MQSEQNAEKLTSCLHSNIDWKHFLEAVSTCNLLLWNQKCSGSLRIQNIQGNGAQQTDFWWKMCWFQVHGVEVSFQHAEAARSSSSNGILARKFSGFKFETVSPDRWISVHKKSGRLVVLSWRSRSGIEIQTKWESKKHFQNLNLKKKSKVKLWFAREAR